MGRNNSSIRVFFEEMGVIWSKCRFRMAFASKLSFRLLFICYCLKTWCSKTYNSIALSITKLLLFLNQLSNCKRNIFNRDPHFMLTITPSLSTVTGKVSECFLRAMRLKIQQKRIVLAWGSSRCSMLQVRTLSLRRLFISFS